MWLLLAILLVGGLFGLRAVSSLAVSGRIRNLASVHGLDASWRTLEIGFSGRVKLTGILVAGARGDTVFRAESLSLALDPWSILFLRPRVRRVSLAHARVLPGLRTAADPDTSAPLESREPDDPHGARARLARSAEGIVRLLLAPARHLPGIVLRDVAIVNPTREDAILRGTQLQWLTLERHRGGIRLSGHGSLLLDRPVPFEAGLTWGHDDRITGGARFLLPNPAGEREPLRIAVDGRVVQDRREDAVRLVEPTRVTIGDLPLDLSGSFARAGPRLTFALTALQIIPERVITSLPRSALGPLSGLSVRGTFDYRLTLDLDLSRPDSVEVTAKVAPHGLRIDPVRTRLAISELEEPFVATIHLPGPHLVERDLSDANPRFRPLEAIDSTLAHAVVTNEDGGFFRHRGFNLDAVKGSIAENVKAGAFRRGAGTITMQLARNLYLGHDRTLSRKAQEVVLAWVIENLTTVSKRRLLEIYLNVIEWGPGIHGADEAALYYFGHDAGRLTVDEALFLSTVVPAPKKWRYRFEADGTLRPFARAQMHFIGRAMIAKGWLSENRLPAADSLRVTLAGPARWVLFPPADSVEVAAPDGMERPRTTFRAPIPATSSAAGSSALAMS